MKKFIKSTVLLICLLVIFQLVSATTIWTNEGIKINQAREKIEVGTNGLYGPIIFNVTDIFTVNIPLEMKNETIFFSVTPTWKDSIVGPNISNVSGGIGETGLCQPNFNLNDEFGLNCLSASNFKNNALQKIKVNNINLIEINASDLDWKNFLDPNEGKVVYIYLNYILHNPAIETSGQVTIWVQGLRCDQNYPSCFNGSKVIYLSVPTPEYFPIGGDNYQVITTLDTGRRFFDQGTRMIFFTPDPEKDLFLSLQDIRGKNFNEFKWFLSGIFLSFFLSLIANSIFFEKVTWYHETMIFLSGLLSLVAISFTFEWNTNIILLIIFIIIIIFCINQLNKYFNYAPAGKERREKIIRKYPRLRIFFEE